MNLEDWIKENPTWRVDLPKEDYHLYKVIISNYKRLKDLKLPDRTCPCDSFYFKIEKI